MIQSEDLFEKTALSYWSEPDDCYVVYSPFLPMAIGEGATLDEALAVFRELVAEARRRAQDLAEAETTRLEGEPFAEPISMTSSRYLSQLAARLGLSRGDAIDYLVAFHKVAVLPDKPGAPPIEPVRV